MGLPYRSSPAANSPPPIMHPPPRWFPLVRQLVQRALASAESSGFRVSNDLAIAIAHLRAAANLTRFAVADLDVHQGDGTAHMIAHDPNAFEFQPEFDFYQSGVDGLKADTPGKSDLTIEGLAARDHRASSSARKHGAPLVITIGGGYADPIELTAAAHAKTYRLAAELAS